jgi:hypothetical protein
MTARSTAGPAIRVQGLEKSYGKLEVLRGLDFHVARAPSVPVHPGPDLDRRDPRARYIEMERDAWIRVAAQVPHLIDFVIATKPSSWTTPTW